VATRYDPLAELSIKHDLKFGNEYKNAILNTDKISKKEDSVSANTEFFTVKMAVPADNRKYLDHYDLDSKDTIVKCTVDRVLGTLSGIPGFSLDALSEDPLDVVHSVGAKNIPYNSPIPTELLTPLPSNPTESRFISSLCEAKLKEHIDLWKKYVEFDKSAIYAVDTSGNKILLVDHILSRTIYMSLSVLNAASNDSDMAERALDLVLNVAYIIGLGASGMAVGDANPAIGDKGIAAAKTFIKEIAEMIVHFTNYELAEKFIIAFLNRTPSKAFGFVNVAGFDLSLLMPADMAFRKEVFTADPTDHTKKIRFMGFDEIKVIEPGHGIKRPSVDGCPYAPAHLPFSIDILNDLPSKSAIASSQGIARLKTLAHSIGYDKDPFFKEDLTEDSATGYYILLQLLQAQMLSGGMLPKGSEKYLYGPKYMSFLPDPLCSEIERRVDWSLSSHVPLKWSPWDLDLELKTRHDSSFLDRERNIEKWLTDKLFNNRSLDTWDKQELDELVKRLGYVNHGSAGRDDYTYKLYDEWMEWAMVDGPEPLRSKLRKDFSEWAEEVDHRLTDLRR
jgi:hypothetical protein